RLRGAVHEHPLLPLSDQQIGHQRDVLHVIEMRMGEEDVVDLEDVVELQGGGDRPAVDGQLLLDEESGGAVSGKLAAVAPEDLDAHQSPSRRPGRAAEAQRTARGRTRSYGGE